MTEDKDKTKLTTNQVNSLSTSRKIGLPKLHAAIAHKAIDNAVSAAQMPHRIALLLDTSGSMHGAADANADYYTGVTKMSRLRDAITSFINACNFDETALALESFPHHDGYRLPLTSFQPLLLTTIMTMEAGGGTPMSQAMEFVLASYSMTRAVLISDGCADNPAAALDKAGQFREAEVPIDCVHIGQDTSGEQNLRDIAERTGGLFIKFTDVAAFATNFKFLTPSFRGMLMAATPEDAARLLGAKEVK